MTIIQETVRNNKKSGIGNLGGIKGDREKEDWKGRGNKCKNLNRDGNKDASKGNNERQSKDQSENMSQWERVKLGRHAGKYRHGRIARDEIVEEASNTDSNMEGSGRFQGVAWRCMKNLSAHCDYSTTLRSCHTKNTTVIVIHYAGSKALRR